MRVTRIFAAVALGLAGNLALAADPDQAIRSSLKAIDPEMKIEAIAESPLTGIFEVHLPGGRVLYSSADGQYMLQGFLYQFKNGQALNLTEQVKGKAIAKEIAKVPPPTVPSPQMPTFTGFTLLYPIFTVSGRSMPRPHKRAAHYEARPY